MSEPMPYWGNFFQGISFPMIQLTPTNYFNNYDGCCFGGNLDIISTIFASIAAFSAASFASPSVFTGCFPMPYCNNWAQNRMPMCNSNQRPKNKGDEFAQWTEDCAKSIVGVKEDKKTPIYNSDIESFNMARTPEYEAAVKADNQDEALKIYKQNAEKLASDIVDNADIDHDGRLNFSEFRKKEIDDVEKLKCRKLSNEEIERMEPLLAKQYTVLNANGTKDDKYITKEEYTAFLYAMDANNDKDQVDGKISRDEYSATCLVSESDVDAIKEFRDKIKFRYQLLYKSDPMTAEPVDKQG